MLITITGLLKYLRNGAKMDGGPGSGRYPKGSGIANEVSATGANKFSKGFSKKNLDAHFGGKSDHSSQYPDLDKNGYADRALELIQKPVGGNIKGYKNKSGQIARYDADANDYVKGKPNIGIATMFKPKRGAEYFNEWKQKEGVDDE